jgi:hypothetical protein
MALLPTQNKTTHVKQDFKIPVPVMEDLKLYAQMTDSDLDHVVIQALQYVFAKDTDFREFKRQNPAASVEEIQPKRPGRRPLYQSTNQETGTGRAPYQTTNQETR